MIRVLHLVAAVDSGGIERMILNYYRTIDRSNFQFDVAITKDSVGMVGKELQALGATIHHLPLKSLNFKAFLTSLEKLLQTEKYDVIHVHENSTSYVALAVAKKVGVPLRIAHSHSSNPTMTFSQKIRRLSGVVLNSIFATHLLACGKKAAIGVYGKNNYKRDRVTILPNAIYVDEFAYNPDMRNIVRTKFAWDDVFVVGVIGRLEPPKNIQYAIHVYNDILIKHPNSCLCIVGDGWMRNEIEFLVKKYNMQDKVLFLGERGDVPSLLQAFDVLLMPSIYEGLPVVAIEAAASGLPIVLSDTVTEEISFIAEINYVSLKASYEEWATEILKYTDDRTRTSRGAEVAENGYDIKRSVKIIEEIYSS